MSGAARRDTELEAWRDKLESIRAYRVLPDRARPIGEDCARIMGSIERVSAAVDDAQRAWEAGAPGGIRALAWVVGVTRGRVTLGVRDAAARHRVDRWIRSGGLGAMRRHAGGPIASVRTRLDPR